jgi:hypothetical protein
MKTVTKSFKILSFATIIFCAAATGTFAGQYSHGASVSLGSSYSGHSNYANVHTNSNARVQTNRNGASGRHYSGTVRGQGSHGSAQVNVNNHGASARHQHGTRHHQVFGW